MPGLGIEENIKNINTNEEAEKYGRLMMYGHRYRAFRFQSSIIKHYFFSLLKQYIPDIIIINCDSSEDRFNHDIQSLSDRDVVIFDNSNKIPLYMRNNPLFSKNTLIF